MLSLSERGYDIYTPDRPIYGTFDRYGPQALAYTIKARKRAECDSKRYRLLLTTKQALIPGTKVTHNSYEYDKQGRLHIHGIFKIDQPIPYQKFQQEGYVVNITRLRTQQDVSNWKLYCDKDQDLTSYTQSPTKECPPPPNRSLFKRT